MFAMFAELRTVQERMQQLSLDVNKLADLIKGGTTATNARLDAQESAARTSYAQQKSTIDSLVMQFSTLGEQVRANSVQVSKMETEIGAIYKGLETVTNLLTQLMAQIPAAGATGATGDPSAAAQPPIMVPPSPGTLFNNAMGYYAVGSYELAISAFEEYLKNSPSGGDAPKAQYFIGESYAASQPPNYNEAVAAYEKVITNSSYRASGSEYVPSAYYKQGLAYEHLKKNDLAIKDYRTLMSDFKDSAMAIMAQKALERLTKRGSNQD